MLQIQQISKQYRTASLVQQALDQVTLNLRDNEFVAVLGPSGSGRTTLLNIIGGLDRYDNGNLIINGVSTKDYSDRDWDSYRNHTVGFVFQSYNLIPHQTILSNVELALTISGVSRNERQKRAILALKEVGLEDHLQKRPNQLSGGQMQRVAIARALVNDPDILLADEPTGALDSTTSAQVMELLKKVAKNRLVVMVTHNPELAKQYATRIVKLKDGKMIADSHPFYPNDALLPPIHKNMGKASMSLLTAFSLSLNNLLTKKGRTILTAFAGSIGIIGIALILSLSTGFQNYINQIQEETLTSYPFTLTSETADITNVLLAMTAEGEEKETTEGTVKEVQKISKMFANLKRNDLSSFQNYLEKKESLLKDKVSTIQYSYDVDPLIYIKKESKITQVNPNTLLSSLSGTSGVVSNIQSSNSAVFREMIDDPAMLSSQYEVLAGEWPKQYNEMVLVLNNKDSISELLVYCMGLRDSDELKTMLSKIMAGKSVDNQNEPLSFTYEELLNLSYRLIDASDLYRYNEKYGIYEDMREDDEYLEQVFEKSEPLKMVGIVTAKEGVSASTLSSGIYYTKDLTKHVITKATQSPIVKKQLENEEINVFSGKRFKDENKNAGLDFQDMISVDTDLLSSAFGMDIDKNAMQDNMQRSMNEIASLISTDTSQAKNRFLAILSKMTKDMLTNYVNEHNNPMVMGATLSLSDVEILVDDYMGSDAAKELLSQLETEYILPQSIYLAIYQPMIKNYLVSCVQMSSIDQNHTTILLNETIINALVAQLVQIDAVTTIAEETAAKMSEAAMKKNVLIAMGKWNEEMIQTIANSMHVDGNIIKEAFHFELNEEELTRLISTRTSNGVESNAISNLAMLGYQDMQKPTSISFYFKDFEAKEEFLSILDEYNEEMMDKDDNKVIQYTDVTGILMSSVSVIVNSVSYVLIAFVSISLIVSSIMIGIITYISVMERTKEIGILRAIGASRKNISSIFNAETFMIGFCSGLIGIGVTLLLLPPINTLIHNVSGNLSINAVLPLLPALTLMGLSIFLTLLGGWIPSKQASHKDPVTALRSE